MQASARWTGVIAISSLALVGAARAYGEADVKTPVAVPELAQSQRQGAVRGAEYAAAPGTKTVTTANFKVPKGHTYMVQVAATEELRSLVTGRCASPAQSGGAGFDVILDGHRSEALDRLPPTVVPGQAHTVASEHALPVGPGHHAFHIVVPTIECKSGIVGGRYEASHARLVVSLLADFKA